MSMLLSLPIIVLACAFEIPTGVLYLLEPHGSPLYARWTLVKYTKTLSSVAVGGWLGFDITDFPLDLKIVVHAFNGNNSNSNNDFGNIIFIVDIYLALFTNSNVEFS